MYLVDRLHQVVRGCQEGDPAAQRELYDMFKSKMFGICLRYAGNFHDAEDILQEGFIKVFEKIHQYAYRGAFEGWIRRIMVNSALEKYRVHFKPVALGEELTSLEEEDLTCQPSLELEELVKMVQELSPQYRLIFNLYAIEGYTHKEISNMLNITEGTSKSNLSRARAILQDKVNRYYVRSVKTS